LVSRVRCQRRMGVSQRAMVRLSRSSSGTSLRAQWPWKASGARRPGSGHRPARHRRRLVGDAGVGLAGLRRPRDHGRAPLVRNGCGVGSGELCMWFFVPATTPPSALPRSLGDVPRYSTLRRPRSRDSTGPSEAPRTVTPEVIP
jgi:hypothetical protein